MSPSSAGPGHAMMPRRTWPQRALLALVRGYRYFLSPWLGSACRFEPTCSSYALQALERHGAAAGSYLAVRRLGRCHPWCPGGLDAVPDVPPRLFPHRIAAPPISRPAPPATHQRSRP